MDRSGPVETDSDKLIQLAIQGDRQAFGVLYEQHVHRIYRHAFFLTSDAALAEDLTAQTFLKALEAMPRYESRGVPFVAWLMRITCNLSINYKKSRKNNGHLQLPETIEAQGRGYSPEETCEATVDGAHVWDLVRDLPCEQQQVIVMRFAEDLGYPEIAGVLGKSVGAVRVIQFRALAHLRLMMDAETETAREPVLARAS